MTKVARSHLLAELAVLAISEILNRAGALTEQIRNDYGEDLLVQTHLNNYADNFKLLIQVKGTALKKRPNQTKTIRLKTDHLLRWISQSDPVLVCVYDESDQTAYAFSPSTQFSLWELSNRQTNTVSIKLTAKNVFNVDTARQFIWNCRIDHWSRMVSWYENHINYEYHFDNNRTYKKANFLNVSVVVLAFLKAMKIVETKTLSKTFLTYFRNASKNFAKTNLEQAKDHDSVLNLRSAVMLAMLGHVDDVCGCGLPSNLLERGTDLCGTFLHKWHESDWRRSNQLLPDDNWLSVQPRKKQRKTSK